MKWYSLVAFGLLCSIGTVSAQIPSISAVQPAAVTPGGTVDLTVTGANLAGGPQLWTRFASQAVLAPDLEKNGEDPAKVVFRVTVPETVSPGIYGIRVGTSGGVSQLKLLMVDDLKTVARDGANAKFAQAQKLELPLAVDGRVDAVQMQYYRFSASAGQRLAFEVFARRFGSALDPMIRLLDADGREISYSDDAPGLSGDSQLAHVFEKAGEYVLELRDIRFQGGGNHLYRLRIGDFPLVSVPFPQAVQKGRSTKVGFAGVDVGGMKPVDVNVSADSDDEWICVSGTREGGNCSAFASLAVSSDVEVVESEPNNSSTEANPIEVGANVNGQLLEPGDLDFYKFQATKGQKLIFESWTRRQGSPADVMVEVWKVGGGKLAEADDNGKLDGRLVFTVPEDGEFAVAVRDLHRRGGAAFGYRIVTGLATPDFVLNASSDRLNVPSGGTAQVSVSVSRQDYAGAIEVRCEGLPKGVTSVPTTLGPGRNAVVLTLRSDAGIGGGQMSPVRVVGKAQIGDTKVTRTASISPSLQAASNAMPWPVYLLDRSTAVGVTTALPYRIRTEPAEVVLGRNLKTTFKVVVERNEGYDEQVDLKLLPEKDGVPGGIGVAVKPIPKGQNEVVIEINANDKAPMGGFTAVLNSTMKKDKATFAQPVPGLSFRMEEPMSVSTSKAVEIGKGQKLSLPVTVQRNPSLQAKLTVTLQNLPAGVTAAPLEIAADKSEGTVELTATADAAAANISNAVVVVAAMVGDKKFQSQSPPLTLVVK